jgi:hypothetical protein
VTHSPLVEWYLVSSYAGIVIFYTSGRETTCGHRPSGTWCHHTRGLSYFIHQEERERERERETTYRHSPILCFPEPPSRHSLHGFLSYIPPTQFITVRPPKTFLLVANDSDQMSFQRKIFSTFPSCMPCLLRLRIAA